MHDSSTSKPGFKARLSRALCFSVQDSTSAHRTSLAYKLRAHDNAVLDSTLVRPGYPAPDPVRVKDMYDTMLESSIHASRTPPVAPQAQGPRTPSPRGKGDKASTRSRGQASGCCGLVAAVVTRVARCIAGRTGVAQPAAASDTQLTSAADMLQVRHTAITALHLLSKRQRDACMHDTVHGCRHACVEGSCMHGNAGIMHAWLLSVRVICMDSLPAAKKGARRTGKQCQGAAPAWLCMHG